MPLIYSICNGNAREAARVFRLRYPPRMKHFNCQKFIGTHNGSCQSEIRGVPMQEESPQLHDVNHVINQLIRPKRNLH